MDEYDPLAEAADEPLISAERMLELKSQAIDQVRAEAVKAEEARILKAEIAKLKAKNDPEAANDDIVSIFVDLAEHSAFIQLDGVQYFHGFTYKMARRKANTIREIIYRGWRHQNEIDGKTLTQHYQSKRSPVLSGAEQAA